MSLFCVVSYSDSPKADAKAQTFKTGNIQTYCVCNARNFLMEDRYKKSIKELFEIIRKTRGILIGLSDEPAATYFTKAFEAKSEFSLRVDLVQTWDKGKGPPVVKVVETMGPASEAGANIARLDLGEARVANKWRSELGSFRVTINAKQASLRWVDQDSEEPAKK